MTSTNGTSMEVENSQSWTGEPVNFGRHCTVKGITTTLFINVSMFIQNLLRVY